VEVGRVIKRHVDACRALRPLRDAYAIIIPEANLHDALEVQRAVRNEGLENAVFMNEDSSGSKRDGVRQRDRPGSVTTHRKKLEMVRLLINNYMKPRAICFAKQFITVEKEACRVDDVEREIVAQLRNFKKKRTTYRDADGIEQFEFIYSGKLTADKQDDFPMCLLIACYHKEIFFDDHRYEIYWRTENRRE
jgi:hypothetical protein